MIPLMRQDSRSHGLWELTAPPPPPTTPLRGEVRAGAVVVGGGFTGMSAALHLAEGGADVVLLEAVEIGFGASGRNVGLVNAGMWVMPSELPNVLGQTHGERLLRCLGEAPDYVFELIARHAIACEPVRAGTLHCGVGESGRKELAAREAEWRALGAPVRLLDAAETAAKTGMSAYSASLLDFRAGTIQPLAYVRGLATAAAKAGARLHTDSPVTAIAEDGGGWRVSTAEGSVLADWVVVATDMYGVGPWPQIREQQVQLPYFNVATKPLSPNVAGSILPERQGVWDTATVMTSFRKDAAGRLVFGSIGALRGTGTAVHRAWARRALARHFPQLAEVPFEAEWWGSIGMTADHLPHFHRLARNVVTICGYNGRGIAPGTVCGRALAELVLGRIAEADLPLPVSEPVPIRLRAAREAYYEVGAQIAHAVGART